MSDDKIVKLADRRKKVAPDRSVASGGVLFDDTHGMTFAQINLLCEREVLYMTKWTKDGLSFAGCVAAPSWEAAQATADERGLGEIIVGMMGSVIPA